MGKDKALEQQIAARVTNPEVKAQLAVPRQVRDAAGRDRPRHCVRDRAAGRC